MPQRTKTAHFMFLVSGLILLAAACKKNTGRGSDSLRNVSVSGNDVYVAGYQLTSTHRTTALYWKNGVASYLTTDSISGSQANSLFISGKDVYIAGYQNVNNYSRAIYWKNGVPVTLTTEARSAAANSIFVAGNDVYVAGYQWTIGGYYITTYWKNGEAVKLTDGTKNVIANSIHIQ